MISVFVAQLARDLSDLARGGGGWAQPALFATLYAALAGLAASGSAGSDQAIVLAPATLWLGALLAAQLAGERLVRADVEDGSIDQWAASDTSLVVVAAAKTLAHWLATGAAVVALTPALGVFLGVPPSQGLVAAGALALGTPAASAYAVMAASLAARERGGGMLAALIAAPLSAPTLIFGVAAVADALDLTEARAGAWRLLAASTLLALAIGPPASAAALRAQAD